MPVATCLICGCTDNSACHGSVNGAPCYWVFVDYSQEIGVCSECVEFVQALRKGTLKEFAERKLRYKK